MINQFNPDVLLVPGAGEIESDRRARYTAILINGNLVDKHIPIIVSGGIPKTFPILQNTHGKSEAQIMYEALIRRKIDPEQIYLDNEAQSTAENLQNLRYKIERHEIKSLTTTPRIGIVDGKTHSPRTQTLAYEILYNYPIGIYTVPFYSPEEGIKGLAKNVLCEGIGGLLEVTRKFTWKNPQNHAFYNNH